jgi:hypothetical protein
MATPAGQLLAFSSALGFRCNEVGYFHKLAIGRRVGKSDIDSTAREFDLSPPLGPAHLSFGKQFSFSRFA